MALASNSVNETLSLCKSLLTDDSLCNSIIQAQKKNINLNTDDDIANFLIKQANHRRE